MNHITPDYVRMLELACAIRTTVLGGAFGAFLALVFIDDGRALRLLIGG